MAKKDKKKLSIIIPYFNTWEYTKPLLDKLKPQLTAETELIIIDDGCNETLLDDPEIRVIHLEKNVGVGGARNVGIEEAKGDYITFIDSDDGVEECYVNEILDKINNSKFDVCAFGWKFGNWHNYRFIGKNFMWPVWCFIYNREHIGNTRFTTDKTIPEDELFNNEIKSKNGKTETLSKYLYIYFRHRPNSVSYKMRTGFCRKEE